MAVIGRFSCSLLVLSAFMSMATALEEITCYGPGSIAATVFITIIVTLLIVFFVYLFLTRYWKRNNEKHLILETDPEKGKGEYAFDNPGFKDATFSSSFIEPEKSKSDSLKTKWSQWSPLRALTNVKNEKRTYFDDSVIGKEEIKVVCLRSHDFTGLGFNIFGNMRDGIFIKDVLHRGPAFESGKLKPGDCIKSITISFEHIVYEDALTILSYASPYEVIIEAQGEKRNISPSGQVGFPRHPLFRSASSTDLVQIGKTSKKRLFQANAINNSLNSSFSSLQKNRSNETTLERKRSSSPNLAHKNQKETLKIQLEQRILEDHDLNLKNKLEIYEGDPKKVNMKMQTSENKHHKFGIRVLPPEVGQNNKEQISPKTMENSQNDNNTNLEKNSLLKSVMSEYDRLSIDEIDNKGKYNNEKEQNISENTSTPVIKPEEDISSFQRSPNQSSVRRDENGIPQEIPIHMHDVAMVAKRNRKSSADIVTEPKKNKGRAPAPPEEMKPSINTNNENGEIECCTGKTEEFSVIEMPENMFEKCKINPKENVAIEEDTTSNEKRVSNYSLDSDAENENNSSANTISLNSSDITIHHTDEDEDIQDRKTASTGDLSKIHKTKKSSGSGTLERAQSLDIADTGISSTKKRKIDKPEMGSDESVYEKYMIYKEPRLSLVLDGLNTFQRSRLKKSTEWGNLEDAILNLDKEVDLENTKEDHEDSNSKEFDALVNKVNEIKKENINNLDNEDRSDASKKDVLHKTYNNLTEIDYERKSFGASKTNKPEVRARNILTDIGNVTVSVPKIDDISLEDIEIEISNDDALSNNVIDKKIKKSSVEFPSETNGITSSEIEMYLAEEKVEVPKRKPKNQIWPSVEKPFVPSRKPEPMSREKNRNVSVNDENKKESQKAITVSTIELKNVEKSIDEDTLKEVKISPETESPTHNSSTTVTLNINSSNNPRLILSEKRENEKSKLLISSKFFKPKLMKEMSEKIINAERMLAANDPFYYTCDSTVDLNVSDDIKVSRHSLGSLATSEPLMVSIDNSNSLSEDNVCNIMIESPPFNTEDDQLLSSSKNILINNTENDLNNTTLLYTTASDETILTTNDILKTVGKVEIENQDKGVAVTAPDIIKNITLTEVINTVNTQMSLLDTNDSNSLKFQIMGEKGMNSGDVIESNKNGSHGEFSKASSVNITDNSLDSNDSLSFVTEIQVSPSVSVNSNSSDPSEIYSTSLEDASHNNLENKFENYVKNFEANRKMFDSPVVNTTNKLESRIPSKVTINNEKTQPDKELQKIQQIVEEQLKKLPEMRFSTSSYESSTKIPEKRSSHIEQIRSNFEKNTIEKSPTKLKQENGAKSRIPVAMQKTPPTSPERRDSRTDTEINSDILELMSSKVHSTPISSNHRHQLKTPTKNVTVTSIRGNSKIPSGIPGRPPIPSRKPENMEVHTNGNGEGNFKQWVFTQSETAVTNIVVDNFKPEQK